MATNAQFQDELQDRTTKSYWLMGLFTSLFFILLLRLFFLQIIQADTHIRLSKENQMKLKIMKAPRGIIYDRNGEILARNRPSFSIGVLPYQLQKKVNIIDNLLKIRDTNNLPIFDSIELEKRMTIAKYRRFDVTILKEDISLDIVSVIEEHSMEIPGIIVQTEMRREYPLGPKTFHVLGYMNEIPESIFDSLKEKGYFYGDKIGNAGIEKEYETILKGENGVEYIEVNAYGRSLGPIEDMPRKEPIPGNDLYLTINAQLQEATWDTISDTCKGASVALNPQNGEVLVMLSKPSVDPNIFSLSANLRSKSWEQAARDPDLPLNNRATNGTYPPGSTFKLISALAGLESGKLEPDSKMSRPCTGAFYFGNRQAECWKKAPGHGFVDLKEAIKVSCNVYFYQVGLLVGDKKIVEFAKLLGLGQISGIDLPSEVAGFLSGEEAFNSRFKNRGWRWTQGQLLNLAIGQSQIVTPIQLALMVGGIGNGHVVYKPFLLKEIRNSQGIVIKQISPEVIHMFNLKPESIELLHQAMDEVVNVSGGTAGRSRLKDIRVGGKTGSAQNPHGELTHGLFIACAPMQNPEIAAMAILENAGHGGTVAAPIIGHMMDCYFHVLNNKIAH